MRLSASLPRKTAGLRRGFTLVELLMVLAIISILVALTVSGLMRYMEVQVTSNTKGTIEKIQSSLTAQQSKTIVYGRKATVSASTLPLAASGTTPPYTYTNSYSLISAMAGDQGNETENAKRRQAIYLSYLMKQQYPASFAEVLLCHQNSNLVNTPQAKFFNPLGWDQSYYTKLGGGGSLPGNFVTNDPGTPGESSALLLMALEKSLGGAGKVVDTFGANCVQPQSFPTTSKPVDVPVLKDDWGTPIEFFRWTTANADVNNLGPTSGQLRNPLDPEGKLLDPKWIAGVYTPDAKNNPNPGWRQLFEQSCYAVTLGTTPYAYYIVPVVASAGPNKRLGLNLLSADAKYNLLTLGLDGTGDDTDNIYSYQVKKE